MLIHLFETISGNLSSEVSRSLVTSTTSALIVIPEDSNSLET